MDRFKIVVFVNRRKGHLIQIHQKFTFIQDENVPNLTVVEPIGGFLLTTDIMRLLYYTILIENPSGKKSQITCVNKKRTIVKHFVSAFPNGERQGLEIILDRNWCLNI